MVLKCPKGMIVRAGGKVKAFTRKSGVKVKAANREPVCIKPTGAWAPGRTPEYRKVLPKLRRGLLGQYGYKNIKSLSAAQRHAALKKGVDAEGYSVIIKRLNAVANYTTTSDPEAHRKYRNDIKWVQDNLSQYSVKGKRTGKAGISGLVKAGTYKTRDGRAHQLYKVKGSNNTFYRYKLSNGKIARRYI